MVEGERPMNEHYKPNPSPNLHLTTGSRVKVYDDRRWWDVRAQTEDVVVLTRKAAFRDSLRYCVIDYRSGVRGPVNVIGQGWEVDTDEQCQELASIVQRQEFIVSHRNWVPIEIVAERAA